jgi:hypothetical protein
MRSLLQFFLILALFSQNIFSSQEKNITTDPVMTIRFNTEDVSYQNKLGNILDKIFEINKDAKFLLVSLMRSGANADDKEFSQLKAQEVSEILIAHGVSEKNIEYKFVTEKNILNNELHIFLGR